MEKDFKADLENLFDIAHANALQMIRIEEDREFLLAQREEGRRGYMAVIDKQFAAQEDRKKEKKSINDSEKENKKRNKVKR